MSGLNEGPGPAPAAAKFELANEILMGCFKTTVEQLHETHKKRGGLSSEDLQKMEKLKEEVQVTGEGQYSCLSCAVKWAVRKLKMLMQEQRWDDPRLELAEAGPAKKPRRNQDKPPRNQDFSWLDDD